MQIIVNINHNNNTRQLDRIAGHSIVDKLETVVQHLTLEFGVYASAGQTASGVWFELDEGSPVDFIKGIDSYKFF